MLLNIKLPLPLVERRIKCAIRCARQLPLHHADRNHFIQQAIQELRGYQFAFRALLHR